MASPTSRRSLLRFLLSSPLAFTSISASSLQVLLAKLAEGHDITPPERALITKVEQAIDVFDFETLAKERLLPAHWTYLSMGVQQEVTLRANRSAFDDYALRPRRLVDTRNLDTRLELFGQALTNPILLCPCGSQRAYHAEGELAVARAARSRDHLMILSNVTAPCAGNRTAPAL